MNTLRYPALGVLALTATLSAQSTTVFPSAATSVDGDSVETRFPFGYGISRAMGIYDAWDLQIPDGASITSVGFRQELGRTSPATGIQLEVYMGPAAPTTSARTPSTTFANNYDNTATPTRVFGPAVVNLPALNNMATTAQIIDIPLSTPYTYDASKGLIVEFRVLANSNANQVFNYFIDRSTFFSDTSVFGSGCPSSAGTTPAFAFQPTFIGGNLIANIRQAPASSLVFFNFDFRRPPPPIDMTAFGAPGCTLYVAPRFLLSTTSNTSGNATFSISVPDEPAIYDREIFGQALVFDLFANSLGFVTSNQGTVQLGSRGAMGTVFAQGSTTAATGSRRGYLGVVTIFGWQ